MLPARYAVHSASTEAQVVRRLANFLDYIRSCHIESLLPEEFSRITAGSADEIRDWATKLAAAHRDRHPLTVAGQYWMEEIRESFGAAMQRLQQIETLTTAASDATSRQPTPSNQAGIPDPR